MGVEQICTYTRIVNYKFIYTKEKISVNAESREKQGGMNYEGDILSYHLCYFMKEYDLLKFAVENGMVDLQQIQEELDMKNRQELLAQHPYSIWQSKDGKYYYTYFPDKERRRIQKKRTSKVAIENLIIDYQKQQINNPTIEEVFQRWNNRRLELQKIAPSTHERNDQVFRRHYIDIKNMKIKDVSVEFLSDFLEEQIPKHELSAKGFGNLKTITRGLFKRAKKENLIDFNIEDIFNEMELSDREFKKVIKEDCEEVFDEEETEKIMSYLYENLDAKNLAILLAFLTGLRAGELVALKHEDFDETSVKVRRTEVRYKNPQGKGYIYEVKPFPKTQAGVRTIPIPPDYIWVLKRIKATNPFGEYVFVEKGKRMTTNYIRRRLGRVCKQLSIHPKSPHKIRKTYGTILIDNHVDNRMIIDVMGHTNILCTENNYHRNRKTLQKKADIIGTIPDFQLRAIK